MNSPDAEALRVLLSDLDWLRSLARALVPEVDLAEDAAQDVWVAALERQPRDASNPRAWLAQVARNAVRKARRGERRRRDREHWVAREEAVPSTLDVVEQFSTQHGVATAVLELEEPLRETLLLRFYRDLTLREVGEQMGVPASTVESRQRRALQILRARLDSQHGQDGRTWILALCDGLSLTPRGTSAVPVPLALVTKLSIALVLVTLGGLWVRGRSGGREAASDATAALAGDLHPSGATEARTQRVQASELAGRADRLDLGTRAPADALARGRLVVTVTAHDGTPAAELGVELSMEQTGRALRLPEVRSTWGDGRAVFAGLVPGKYTADVPLGLPTDTHVRPGETTHVALQLPRGPSLHGTVVDEGGNPVAGAGIWLTPEPPEHSIGGRLVTSFVGTRPVARTDERGAFRIASIGDARWIGACAAGRAPSAPADLSQRAGASLAASLVVHSSGGSLLGAVVDEHGVPRAGAMVFLDAASGAAVAPMFATHTDSEGHFEFDSVRAGRRRLLVRAAGLALWRGVAEVTPGERSAIDVRLEPGMSVAGTVTDATGAPVDAALVYATRRQFSGLPDLRHSTATRTGPDGNFVLAGVTPESAWLTVDGGAAGRHEELVRGHAGERILLDVVLSRGLELRGRVTDSSGAALAACIVAAAPRGDYRWRTQTTDEEGRFSFPNCEERPYAVRVVEENVVVARRELSPGADETIVSVERDARPSGTVRGTLVDGNGDPLDVRAMRLRDCETGLILPVAVRGTGLGAFRASGVPPGRYDVALAPRGGAWFDAGAGRSIVANGAIDLGLLVAPPSVLIELHFALPSDAGAGPLHVRVTGADDELLHACHVERAAPQASISFYAPLGVLHVRAETGSELRGAARFEVDGAAARKTLHCRLERQSHTPSGD
ncbi:MAG: sigma-70 family RNA polymerase sigma factor [bacterium]|nr:sigma-70 family RNA polymerase sigma factor [bacterium]